MSVHNRQRNNTDPAVGILDDYGPTVPTDGSAGYAHGCIFRHTDGTAYNDAIYVNIGSVTSCDFNVGTVAQ